MQAGEVLAPDTVTTAKSSGIEKVKKGISATTDDDYKRFRVGGYGEIVANFMDYGLNRFTGTGVMKFKNNAVKIKTTGTPGSDYGFISTSGMTFKLKRVSSSKKFAG